MFQLDPGFKQYPSKYLAQCFMATLVVLFTLYALTIIVNTVVIASIGSTAFIVFAVPHKSLTDDLVILSSYLAATIFGSLCWFAVLYLPGIEFLNLSQHYTEIFGALAVGMTMMFCVIFDQEHPPAASLALGLVIDEWSVPTICVTVIGLAMILGARYLLRRYLINLL
jgi:CBS-domain-containing membrane protein